MKEDVRKIAARIRALLAKTVENGCTEDEAIAAASKAAEMLAKYNLTVEEVTLREQPFERVSDTYNDEVGKRIYKVADAIASLTGTRYWRSSRLGVDPVEINFFGFSHEVEIARYLLAICARSMYSYEKVLRARYALSTPSFRRRKTLPFLDGMADSLRRRILALRQPIPTGRGLIVLRDQLIDAALKDKGLKLKSRARPNSRDFEEDAYRDGRRAGDQVPLNPGIQTTSTSAPRLR